MSFKGQPKLSLKADSNRSMNSSGTGLLVWSALLVMVLTLCVAPATFAQ